MAKFRTSSTALTRTFERTSALIYLVGDDRTIYYANPACCDWIDVELETIFGAQLQYCSDKLPEETENRLKGLCPPVEIFDDAITNDGSPVAPQTMRGRAEKTAEGIPLDTQPSIEFYIASSGANTKQCVWRAARAFRFDDPEDDEFSVLVVSAGEDLESLPTDDSRSTIAFQLHAALAEIRQQSALSHRLDALAGTSPFAQRLRRQATMAANCRADVLIVGPPGSGKEHLARTIHASGPGSQNSDIIPVQCAVADPELLQTIITGRWTRQKHTANSDADSPDLLLLLEVERLSPVAQAELWQLLCSPNFSLRVIATATQCLHALASQGKFETELAHSLSTMTIELLSICERPEDIPLLSQTILERRNSKRKQPLAGFDSPALQMLIEFRWPGNLDQLSSVIRESAAMATASLLTSTDLPKTFHDALMAQRVGRPVETTIELDVFLESIERELLARALQQAKGNKTKAARLLSINRAKFLRRLQYFALETSAPDESDSEAPDFVEPDPLTDFE